tara:strand:+ start:36202 stop:37125 length:924 start_codon:yes stop_codon:yes gene_type:complete
MLQGIFPVIPTMFTPAGALDRQAQNSVVRFALAAGADGVVYPGVASEYSFLSGEECGELIALVVDVVGGQVPVIGGASAQSAKESIALGRAAMSHGIEQLMIMAPASLGDDVSKHQSFFSDVASGLPGCEIILQNAPSPIGAGLAPEAIVEIVRANQAIRYIKEETLPSGPRITAMLADAIPHLQGIFGGGGARYIVDEFRRGSIGALPAVELTDLHAAIYRAHQDGDDNRMRRLYQLSLPLLTSQAIYRMRLTKYILQQRGVADATLVRAPLPDLDSMAKRDVETMLDDLRNANAFEWTEAITWTK